MEQSKRQNGAQQKGARNSLESEDRALLNHSRLEFLNFP